MIHIIGFGTESVIKGVIEQRKGKTKKNEWLLVILVEHVYAITLIKFEMMCVRVTFPFIYEVDDNHMSVVCCIVYIYYLYYFKYVHIAYI